MANALAVSTADFQTKVLDSEIPVLVDFWAPWCGPCKAIGPSVEQIASEYAGKAKVFKVDVDQEPDISSQYGVMSIPALFVFKGGKVVGQHVGAAPKTVLSQLLQRHLA
jgi:thioredoxin 1